MYGNIKRCLPCNARVPITDLTRTHLMARHRKSPQSRRNLIVFELLTPPEGHQFDSKLKLSSVSWSTDHPFLI